MSTLRHPDAGQARPGETSVENLISYISELVLERQQMRSSGASREVLEQNRSLLVAAHWDLSRALIEKYCSPTADPAPAAA